MHAMKPIKTALIRTILCVFLGFTMVGCEKEGPAEKAGKKVD